MSELSEHPDLMLEVIAKLVAKQGGYVEVRGTDAPVAEFNLMSKWDKENGVLYLNLIDGSTAAGTA